LIGEIGSHDIRSSTRYSAAMLDPFFPLSLLNRPRAVPPAVPTYDGVHWFGVIGSARE